MFYFILCCLISFPVFSSDPDPYATTERKPTWAFKLERQVVETDGVPTQQQLIIYGTIHDYPIDMIPLRALEVIKTCDALYTETGGEKESYKNIRRILSERGIISLVKYQDFYKKLSNEAQEALTYLNSIRTEEEKEFFEDIRTIHPGFLYATENGNKNASLYQDGMDSTLEKLFKEQKKHTRGLEKATAYLLTFTIDQIFSHPFYNLENVPLVAENEKILISKAQSKKNEGTPESDYVDDSPSDPLWKEAYKKVDMNFLFKYVYSSTLQRNTTWIEPTIALAAKHKLACILVGVCHVSDSAEDPEKKSYLKLLQENGFSISQMYTDGTFEDYLLEERNPCKRRCLDS